MKYVFFGTPRFAAIVLQELLTAGMPPAALVCNPDRPIGRKQILTAPLTKQAAANSGKEIKILQPEKLDQDFIEELKALQPDFFIVAAYAKIIPQSVLEIPAKGTLGVHPSLLPKYRGASPIQSVILNGEKETGTTIYQMDEKMDHGSIFAQEKVTLSDEDGYLSLEEKLAKLSGELLVRVIPDFAAGKVTAKPQDETKATYTKKFTNEDGFIEEEDLAMAEKGEGNRAKKILQKIHAFNPEPGSWTKKDDKRIKLLEAKMSGDRLVLTKTQTEGEKAKAHSSPL